MQTIWIKEDPLNNILSGKKKIEGRLNKGLFKNLSPNDKVRFCSKNKSCIAIITKIKAYKNFRELLNYNLTDVLPNVSTINEGVIKYNKYYSVEKEYKYGILGIHIEVI